MRLTVSAVALVAMVSPGHAADFSFSGSFASDDEVQLFDFLVGAPSEVTLRTLSYAGGTQADGRVVAAGGFDPILSLFDGAGALIERNDDGTGVPEDPVTGRAYDTALSLTLTPGSYTVAISQYDNFPLGDLAAGFANTGQPVFTDAGNPLCRSGVPFCDITGDQRSNAWAFDILNVETAAVIPGPGPAAIPAPAALPLLLGGLVAIGLLRRRG